jgi:hypothetical protein
MLFKNSLTSILKLTEIQINLPKIALLVYYENFSERLDFTECFGERYTLQNGDERGHDNGRAQCLHHTKEVNLLPI